MTTRREIQARIDKAAAREKEAMIEKARAQAELAALDGREWDRQYHDAYADAQSGVTGGHERFMGLCRRRDAIDILAGKATLTDFLPHERAGIEREVERLRAEQETRLGEGADAPSTAAP